MRYLKSEPMSAGQSKPVQCAWHLDCAISQPALGETASIAFAVQIGVPLRMRRTWIAIRPHCSNKCTECNPTTANRVRTICAVCRLDDPIRLI